MARKKRSSEPTPGWDKDALDKLLSEVADLMGAVPDKPGYDAFTDEFLAEVSKLMNTASALETVSYDLDALDKLLQELALDYGRTL